MTHKFMPTAMKSDDRAAARRLAGWSGAVEARLAVYADLLHRWQKVKNLVGPSTLPEVWMRHFADSAQVAARAPMARTWVDLGSGAGFPGMVTAILAIERGFGPVHLVEGDRRKCAFLREVSRETGAKVVVHDRRIEDALPDIAGPIDGVSARALAPLPALMRHSEEFLLKGAVAVFLKGQDIADELTQVSSDSRFDFKLVPSLTDPRASIVVVKRAQAG